MRVNRVLIALVVVGVLVGCDGVDQCTTSTKAYNHTRLVELTSKQETSKQGMFGHAAREKQIVKLSKLINQCKGGK